ncbi:hypothetical protein OE88DRAFT_1725538 [Heliocybe sulcata]|uniref:Uncharacterized protein n=1 Tax=Heliocybe sulcata TaxID=5364 RepID=A0A5C3N2Q8_9AGAM|nr:hypothetical protein OE88DRAFT_1725538 [Heliocybe sulcata]
MSGEFLEDRDVASSRLEPGLLATAIPSGPAAFRATTVDTSGTKSRNVSKTDPVLNDNTSDPLSDTAKATSGAPTGSFTFRATRHHISNDSTDAVEPSTDSDRETFSIIKTSQEGVEGEGAPVTQEELRELCRYLGLEQILPELGAAVGLSVPVETVVADGDSATIKADRGEISTGNHASTCHSPDLDMWFINAKDLQSELSAIKDDQDNIGKEMDALLVSGGADADVSTSPLDRSGAARAAESVLPIAKGEKENAAGVAEDLSTQEADVPAQIIDSCADVVVDDIKEDTFIDLSADELFGHDENLLAIYKSISKVFADNAPVPDGNGSVSVNDDGVVNPSDEGVQDAQDAGALDGRA